MTTSEITRLRDKLSTHAGERFLSVATTANINNPPLMIGSVRLSEGTLTGNVILRDASLLAEIVAVFEPVVPLFFIDCEIKAGVNLAAAAQDLIPLGRLHYFKPNDFTVEALDEWIAQRISHPSGSKAAVIGAGNIGAKIALRLSERGFDVRLVGRHIDKAALAADGLNVISRGGGLIMAMADTLSACENANLILGCTPGVAAIAAKEIAAAAPNALLIDVGNGTFAPSAISEAHRRSLVLEVLTPTAGWDGFMRRFISTRELQQGLGRRMLENGVWIVSRGVMGCSGDVLVDNVIAPSRVIGVCNGIGDLLYGEDAVRRMKSVEDSFGLV